MKCRERIILGAQAIPRFWLPMRSKARDLLGWTPTRSTLEQMIGSAWDWMQRNPDGYAV